MTQDPKRVALAYIDACGRRDLPAVEQLLAPDVRFSGPGNAVQGATAYLAVLRRIGPIWAGSEVKKALAEGNDVCVFYDFVTDTPAGKVPIVELLRIEHGRVAEVNLVFDRIAYKPAADELVRRASA